MTTGSAWVFPGLVPLAPAEVAAVLALADDHLNMAAAVCEIDIDSIDRRRGSEFLSPTVHEALLAVAIVRRLKDDPSPPAAVTGLSAGCVTALFAADVITEASYYGLIRDLNGAQLEAIRESKSAGMTYALLPSSAEHVPSLLEAFRRRDADAWLSVDLGDGLISISTRRNRSDADRLWLEKVGVAVLAEFDHPEHCPYALPARQVVRDIVEQVSLGPARCPVVSPLGGRIVMDRPEAYRSLLIDQWYDTAELPRPIRTLVDLADVESICFVGPHRSVFATQVRALTRDRTPHQICAIAG